MVQELSYVEGYATHAMFHHHHGHQPSAGNVTARHGGSVTSSGGYNVGFNGSQYATGGVQQGLQTHQYLPDYTGYPEAGRGAGSPGGTSWPGVTYGTGTGTADWGSFPQQQQQQQQQQPQQPVLQMPPNQSPPGTYSQYPGPLQPPAFSPQPAACSHSPATSSHPAPGGSPPTTSGGGQVGPNTSHNQRHNHSNSRAPYDWMKKQTYQAMPITTGKTRTKDKYRIVYSEYQKVELEKEYLYSKYITIQRKAELARSIALSERQVKIWFQNRRAKERKQKRKREEAIATADSTNEVKVSTSDHHIKTEMDSHMHAHVQH